MSPRRNYGLEFADHCSLTNTALSPVCVCSVTQAVSGKTTHLLVGVALEDGRPVEDTKKYRVRMRRPCIQGQLNS